MGLRTGAPQDLHTRAGSASVCGRCGPSAVAHKYDVGGAEVSHMINGGAAKHLAFGQKTMVVVAFLSATLQSLCKERKRRGKEKGKEEEKGEKRRKKRRRERVIMMPEP